MTKLYIKSKLTFDQKIEIVKSCKELGFRGGLCLGFYDTYTKRLHTILNNSETVYIKYYHPEYIRFSFVNDISVGEDKKWLTRHSYKEVSYEQFLKLLKLWKRSAAQTT